jgi:superfamily II DNA/RNA helicase
LLAAIGPADFSKYQRLLQLIRADWGWNGKDPRDRIVLFTGRRETQRFLVEHLAADLGLPKGAVVGLDGAMPDVEQTKVVEQFAQEKEAVRILVATEVASEGLNLHYLSHRLVHVDIPWSLMTLQQRNGRIDRYGQSQQPQIRYLLSCSRSEGMGDAEKVLRLLKRKDEQAQQNIGDPAVFLGVYDAVGEEEEISKAFESGTVEALEQRMDANAQPYLEQGSGDSLFEELFGSGPIRRRQRRRRSTHRCRCSSASPSACSPASGATWTRPWRRWPSRWSAAAKSSICAPIRSSSAWRSPRPAICSAATTATPANCSRPGASAWCSPPRWPRCSGPWSRAAGRIRAGRNWNTSGICTRWWTGWLIEARSPSNATARRCCSSAMASIRGRW